MSDELQAERLHLVLPLPPSQNELKGRHHMQLARLKNRYRKKAWVKAVLQSPPPRDPPQRVELSAVFFTARPWDEDNRAQALKWILDCLKQKQQGRLHWRPTHDLCGYFIDDDAEHLQVTGMPLQAFDAEDPRVEIIIGWTPSKETET